MTRLWIWMLASGLSLGLATAVPAQEIAPVPRPELAVVPEADADADGLMSADELDALLAPIALYPDPLLTQMFVAATVPLDVMKADRWVADNTDLPAGERSAAAETQGWDESVAVLAAGFPSVLQRMAAEIDTTQTLGDAVLAQTDDVLDSVQRLRAQAAATGYLESNEAQTVAEDEAGEISIAPADPEVVYVPAYDAAAAYTAAPTAPTYVTTDPVYAQPGYSTSNLLTTGAIAFGSAMLVNEIFEDDDDDWDDYWGSGSIDWDEDDFHHRPSVDVEGDVNIDRDRNRVVVDGDRTDIGDRPGARDPARDREGTWNPTPQQRAEAKANLDRRKAEGTRPRPEGAGGAGGEGGALGERIGEGGGAGLAAAAGAGAGAAIGGSAARAKLQKSTAQREGAAPRKPSFDSGLSPRPKGAPQVHRAQERGGQSLDRAAHKPQAAKPKAKVAKGGGSRPAVKKSGSKSTAFHKSSGGGRKAQAASKRGHSSGARGGGGRRR